MNIYVFAKSSVNTIDIPPAIGLGGYGDLLTEETYQRLEEDGYGRCVIL